MSEQHTNAQAPQPREEGEQLLDDQNQPLEPGEGRGAGGEQEVIGAGAPTSRGQIKDPDEWVTGDQPMTDAQRGYLDNLAKQAGEQLPANLTKAEASEQIDRLQSGRDGGS